jgi:prepilin-type N-terminal cleavage/methylation domain-containing protein
MLKKTHIFFTKKSNSQGFTLIEVLIAILIATIFVAVSMQAMVLATMLRIKAQEKEKANQLIQEDIETIKVVSASLALDKSKCSATNYNDGYAATIIQSQNLSTAQTTSFSGYTLSLNRNLIGDNTSESSQTIAPHKILKIRYTVDAIKGSATRTIANDYVEIIPNVALQCP